MGLLISCLGVLCPHPPGSAFASFLLGHNSPFPFKVACAHLTLNLSQTACTAEPAFCVHFMGWSSQHLRGAEGLQKVLAVYNS